jgi:hypothetical protein
VNSLNLCCCGVAVWAFAAASGDVRAAAAAVARVWLVAGLVVLRSKFDVCGVLGVARRGKFWRSVEGRS